MLTHTLAVHSPKLTARRRGERLKDLGEIEWIGVELNKRQSKYKRNTYSKIEY